MRWRLTENDVSNRVNVEDSRAVCGEVRAILGSRYPGHDFSILDRVFDDVAQLFAGQMPGYQACDTRYHDLRHTLDITLAMARLMDGHDRSHAEADRLGPHRAALGIVTALLHDSGYIRLDGDDSVVNGAAYTRVHVSRSANFLSRYLPLIGMGDQAPLATQIVHFTGYEIALDQLDVPDPMDRRLGHMLGSADLVGQMSDRLYLEKCRDFLYEEFVHGGIARQTLDDGSENVVYASPADLLSKTPAFHEKVARQRLDDVFEGVRDYAAAHFGGTDPYRDEIERTVHFLCAILSSQQLERLRRESRTLSSDLNGHGEDQPAGQ